MLLFRQQHFVLVISFLSRVSRFLPLLDHQSLPDRKLNTEQARTKETFLCNIFLHLTSFGKLHQRSSSVTAKNRFSYFKIKISTFATHTQKKRKNILNRFEDSFITDRFWHQSCESHDRNIHVLWQLNIHETDYYYDLLFAKETWNDTFCGL